LASPVVKICDIDYWKGVTDNEYLNLI
jgi:hypothetical protein